MYRNRKIVSFAEIGSDMDKCRLSVRARHEKMGTVGIRDSNNMRKAGDNILAHSQGAAVGRKTFRVVGSYASRELMSEQTESVY